MSLPKAKRGISQTIADAIISNISLKTTRIYEETPNQMGAIVDEQDYDERTDVTATVWAAALPATLVVGNTVTIGDHKVTIDSVEEAGTYDQKVKWTVVGHRFTNFPSA